MKTTLLQLLLISISLTLASAQARGETKTLSLAECVELALEQNPAIARIQAGVEEAEAGTRAARSGFGPSLSVQADLIRWDQPTTRAFGGAGGNIPQLPAPTTPYEEYVAQLAQAAANPGVTVIQDQVTWSASATLSQPITPLYKVLRTWQRAGLGEELARLTAQEVREDLAFFVVKTYYGALQARAVVTASQASVTRIEGELLRVQRFFEADLVGRGDVLKVQVALAAAREALVLAENGWEMMKANLASNLGLAPEVEVEPLEVPRVMPSEPLPPLDQLQELAARDRLELHAMNTRVAQAHKDEDVVWSEYLPTVAASATVSLQEGNSFRKESSWYMGLGLSWTAFSWGNTWYREDAARARTRQLEALTREAEAAIRLEVKQAWLGVNAAIELHEAARARVAEAEENFRTQQKLLDADYKTTTDLLDAEANLRDASSREAVAFYSLWVSRAQLSKARGEPLLNRLSQPPSPIDR